MLAIDCETSGIDFFHGARPFFVTTCTGDGDQAYWEWTVDPLTRQPQIPKGELKELRDLIDGQARWGTFTEDVQERHAIVLHNAKFDVAALGTILPGMQWPWGMTRDTLIASHLVCSNTSHNLTDLALEHLNVNIEGLELELENAVQACRRFCRTNLPAWRIAKEDLPEMPSAGEKTWKYDTWLPKALTDHYGARRLAAMMGRDTSRYPVVLQEYANADSAMTVELWKVLKAIILEQGLWGIFKESMRLVPVVYGMEQRGVTANSKRADEQAAKYREEAEAAGRVCTNLAAGMGYDLVLPKGGNNKSLLTFAFEVLKLPPVLYTETGAPSLAKEAITYWLGTLPNGSKQKAFVRNLAAKRQRDTAVQYLEGYKRFWLPIMAENGQPLEDWYVLHPNLNPTGTDTLRGSSNNPNGQNVSKKDGFNLRYPFGPLPGWEWWDLDYENIERRIPAYEAGEELSIQLFERPNDPPYYGSEHLLVAHIIYPREFEQCKNDQGEVDGRVFKERYKSTLYQWTKNFNFAKQYRCGDRKGDATAKVRGASKRVQSRFAKQEELNHYWVNFANKHGYVETLPDKEVCPHRGYPIYCSRGDHGRIKPTIPLSYHVQSTAMWCTRVSMVSCQQKLDEWSKEGFECYVVLQVHDSLVFAMKEGGVKNLPRVLELKRIMERAGDRIGIPLRVSYGYHPYNWSEEVKIKELDSGKA